MRMIVPLPVLRSDPPSAQLAPLSSMLTGIGSVFDVMAKPTGAICNLDCEYCYFLAKESLYPGSDFRMSNELLEIYVTQLLESQTGPTMSLVWQGGEPTMMGLPFFRHMIELVERLRPPDLVVEHAIQTNGTLLDDEWCAFLRDHGVLVGLSMDGPADLHDQFRRDKGGKPTHHRVLRSWELLQTHQVQVNLLCTVNSANSKRPLDVYRYFRDVLGARFMQFIPIVEQEGAGVSSRTVQPVDWGEFHNAIFDEWIARDVGEVFVQIFDVSLGIWLGRGASLCVFSETCGGALALEHNGDLYSCDHFVDPEHLLGNIRDAHMIDLVASPAQVKFGLDKRDALPLKCRECPVLFACRGECPKNRFLATESGELGLNYLCEGYLSFFQHIDSGMRVMAGLLRRGRSPSEVMQVTTPAAAAGV